MDVKVEDGSRQLSFYTLPYYRSEKHPIPEAQIVQSMSELNAMHNAVQQQNLIMNKSWRQTIKLGLAEISVI